MTTIAQQLLKDLFADSAMVISVDAICKHYYSNFYQHAMCEEEITPKTEGKEFPKQGRLYARFNDGSCINVPFYDAEAW